MRVISCLFVLLFAAGCGATSSTSSSGDGQDAAGDDSPGTSPDAPAGGSAVGPYFTTPMFFNRDVSSAAKAANSDAIISALRAEGGWGNGDVMQIDYEIDVLTADNSTPLRSFTPTGDFFTPDCDHVQVPVPANGNIEGETGYACTGDGDCHLIVFQRDSKQLYEMWRADIQSATTFYGGCLAVWHGAQTYTDALRGEQCTSADAAGYPIAPLLFTADEVAAGHIDHAIRFILPNDRVREGFVRPASHATSTTGVTGAPYYGVHLRLRASYPIDSLPTEGARVVARAMQKYGMYHADGGQIALTAQSDRHTAAKWTGLLGSKDLAALRVEDFEVIDHGSMIPLTGDCVRVP